MTTLTIQIPDKEKAFFLEVIKKFNAKVVEDHDSPYNQEFVKEIQESILQKKRGKKGVKLDLNNLWK